MSKKAPKVFVSYSHDSPEHKQWVANLAIRLRENGVDAILDQWDLFPGEDVPSFMEKNLSDCDYAILVCSKRYVEKANSGKGGVGYEKMIVSAQVVKDIEVGKFIPIIRQSGTRNVPTFIQTKLYLDFSNQGNFELVFDELLRTVFKSAVSIKPPLGTPPSFDGNRVLSARQIDLPDHSLKLFTAIAKSYDSGKKTYWSIEAILNLGVTGRIASESALIVLEAKGLLQTDRDGDWVLTEKGKTFAHENGLV